MYRATDPQRKLFDAGGLLGPIQIEACEKSWAGPYRRKALPLLRRVENDFAPLFDAEMGRPNRPVVLVMSVLIFKDMFDLTDQETLEHLSFDARWWYALEMDPHEVWVCQKTLHNFRKALDQHDMSKLAFRRVTNELVRELGVSVARQRLDSTHIVSNIADLTRLGLFCETIRVFLAELRRDGPKPCLPLPFGILRRHGEDWDYGDARKGQTRRRLPVVARDLGRLIDVFQHDEAVMKLDAWKLLLRLRDEQCVVTTDEKAGGEGDDDWGEGGTPLEVKEPKEIASSSMQTPHDPDVTYSGHKGKGSEAQVVESVGNGEKPELITNIEVTPACASDAKATVPMVDALAQAGLKPEELIGDTSYSGAENAASLAQRGVNLLAPCPAQAKPIDGVIYGEPAAKCPTDPEEAAEWLRQRESSDGFAAMYAIRAGSESTNSELKRAHGMGKLRVRGGKRVKLAVYFKALACNVKRALRYWLGLAARAEATAALA